MAEESKSGAMAFEDIMLALFAILLVGQMVEKGPEIISERWGIEFGGNATYLVAGAGLSADTPLGTQVSVPNGGTMVSSPGAEEMGRAVLPGTALVVDGGPETVDGVRWWKVRDPKTGEIGWMPESALIREGVGGVNAGTKVGAKARALLDANVWSAPAEGVKVGLVRMGEWGELTKGPREERGIRWWFFDSTDTDIDGWMPESALALASDTGWTGGSLVKGEKTVDMYERAGSGKIVGLLRKDEKAKILGGPVEVGGAMWWLIKTEEEEEGWVREADLSEGGVKSVLKKIFIFFMIVGGALTLLLLGGIVYITIRTNQVRAKETERIKSAIPKDVEPVRNERWEKIQEHVASENPSEWRLAIIEADVLLDEVVTKMGYRGDTLGEKLKQVVRGDMATLDNAWEAHKIRNQVAHEGSDFILTKREAKRVVELYASVFNEFKVV